MKKVLNLLLITMLAFSLAACGSSGGSGNGASKGGDTPQGGGNNSSGNQNSGKAENATIDETVILDQDGIKITAKSLVYDNTWGPELKVLIENNSSENIVVTSRETSVNGAMIDFTFYCDIAAEKKSNEGISIYKADLETASITTIKEIQFKIRVSNQDTYNEIIETDFITITTNASPDFVQKFDDSGEVVYNDNSFKVVFRGLVINESSIYRTRLTFYVENNTDQSVTLRTRDLSINGFMFDDNMYATVGAGKVIYCAITLSDSDLADNDITQIENLEFYINIYNSKTYNDIVNTDIIKIDL